MFLKIGHRGAKFYAPENTLKGFEKAIRLGVNAIEFDVRKTRDKEVIVFHDRRIDGLTQQTGLVEDLTLRQLRQLRVQGQRIPTLKEALDFIDKKVEKIFIELKVKGIEKKLLNEIYKRKLQKSVVLISFLATPLKNIRSTDKKIETGWIYTLASRPFKTASSLKVNYLLPFYRTCRQSLVEEGYRRELKVVVWTINDSKTAKKYVKRGVAGIITDKPNILADL